MKNYNPKIWRDSYKWQYEAYPYFCSVYQKGARPRRKKYHVFWDDFLNNFNNGQLYAFKPRKKLLKTGREIINELIKGNASFYIEFRKIYKEMGEAINNCLKARRNDDYTNLKAWWPKTQEALSDVCQILFSFDYVFDDFLKELQVKLPDDFNLLSKNIASEKPSFIDKANRYLIHLNRKYPRNFEKITNRFISEYGWFQNSYKGKFKITEKWLKNYLKEIAGKSGKKKKRGGDLPKKYKLLARTASLAVSFRDDKKRLLLIAVDLMEDWLRFVCKRNKWNYEVMRWLSMDEILAIIKNNKAGNIKKAKKYYQDKKRIGIMDEIGYKDISENFWNKVLKSQKINYNINEIKGVIANNGKVFGKVKIIIDVKRDSGKFKKGDILVTSMTRPEFLPLMGRAKAFITDEGGISCHAAIVAREMGKPCIIGTKIATQVLRDGQMVEVDANRGIIKVL